MRRTNSIKKALLAAAVAWPLLMPVTAFAQGRPGTESFELTPDAAQDTDGSAGFCTRVRNLAPHITTRLSGRRADFEARHVELQSARAAERAVRKGELDEVRVKEDGIRSSIIVKLEARAKTNAQKAAVAQFKASMASAISTRRSAVNAAQRAFQDGLEALLVGRKNEEARLIGAYENAVTTAFNKAKADCTNRIRESIVRDRLRASLQEARTQFQASRSQLESQGQMIQGLLDARRTATQRALDEYKARAEAARDALKAAMGAEAGIR